MRFEHPRRFRVSCGTDAGGGAPALAGEWRAHEPMAKHVSWRAGGVAERVYIPAGIDDLAMMLRGLPATTPVTFAGLGSNLLIRDGGLAGVTVLLHGALKAMRLEADGTIYAEAGAAAPKLARFAANHDLVGGEFWAGIPGTVGGALAMNAGCYGSETWPLVAKVLVLTRAGDVIERTPADYEIGYRHVALPPSPLEGEGANVAAGVAAECFLAGWFRLPAGDGAASRARIKELLQKRIASQPLNQPNAGSVFRNPPGDYAARLIEACGLKGHTVGGALVSEKHANFIVNVGGATAADIEQLIDHVQATVEARHGIRLVREVRILGESS